eukprot:Gb_26613 [translate_table: standard]
MYTIHRNIQGLATIKNYRVKKHFVTVGSKDSSFSQDGSNQHKNPSMSPQSSGHISERLKVAQGKSRSPDNDEDEDNRGSSGRELEHTIRVRGRRVPGKGNRAHVGGGNVEDGVAAIVFALAAGTVLSALIRRGENVNAKLKEGLGFSVAHVCAFHGQPDCMRELFFVGVDPNAADDEGVLHRAITKEHTYGAIVILENGGCKSMGILNSKQLTYGANIFRGVAELHVAGVSWPEAWEPHVSVWNTLYAKCGSIEITRQLFDEIPERDVKKTMSEGKDGSCNKICYNLLRGCREGERDHHDKL